MRIFILLFALFLAAGGCTDGELRSVLEELGEEIEGGTPIFTIARRPGEPDRFLLDRISIIEGRPGARARFEAARTDRVVAFETDPGTALVTGFEQRLDGKIVVVTWTESRGDDGIEFLAAFDTDSLRQVRRYRGDDILADMVRLCDPTTTLDRFLQTAVLELDGYVPGRPVEITWQVVPARDIFMTFDTFRSINGDASVSMFVRFEAEITQGGRRLLPRGASTGPSFIYENRGRPWRVSLDLPTSVTRVIGTPTLCTPSGFGRDIVGLPLFLPFTARPSSEFPNPRLFVIIEGDNSLWPAANLLQGSDFDSAYRIQGQGARVTRPPAERVRR